MPTRREFIGAVAGAAYAGANANANAAANATADADANAKATGGATVMPAPPGVSAKDWSDALEKFAAIVGQDNLFTAEADLALYRDAYSPLWNEQSERLVSAAIAPKEVEQVQAIVAAANRYRIPLFPISTGRNLGYGGSAPNLSGSVVVDLKRMNRIIEVNDTRCFAIVEPGVSYFDLYRYIEERGLKVWIDCPDPGWGSLVGNSLDHGAGHTTAEYRDHFRAHSGMEVVLASGEVMRTGMGALPASKTWGEFHYGFGPTVDGLFAQSGFGIVTKMGFHLMPRPEAFFSRRVLVPRRKDIVPLVAIVNRLEYGGLIGMPIFESPLGNTLPADSELRDIVTRSDVWSTDAIDRHAAARKLPVWSCKLQFYGPEQGIAANYEYARKQLSDAIPGVRFEDVETLRFPLQPVQLENASHKVLIGVPNMNIFSIGARMDTSSVPSDGHLLFSPVVPKDGEELLKAQQLFAESLRGTPLQGLYTPLTAPFTWLYRVFALTAGFPVSRSNPEVNRNSREAVQKLIEIGARYGYGEYRATPVFQDAVMATYSFGDHALRRFCEQLKDAADPNGIMAAGRGGIWPKHLRTSRQ